jgi:hypothetical protein
MVNGNVLTSPPALHTPLAVGGCCSLKGWVCGFVGLNLPWPGDVLWEKGTESCKVLVHVG